VDNGSEQHVKENLEGICVKIGAALIPNDANLGVAAALNQGARYARDNSCEWALTMDQDSVVESFLVEALANAYARFPDKEKVAVIGSNYMDEKRGKSLIGKERYRDPPWIEQTTVITSGSLVSMEAFERIGPFRENFFIDHVDDEYCLRARSLGYKVLLALSPAIRHSIGSARATKILGKAIWTSNHSAIRRYYMIRNFTVLAREYLFSEPAWILTRLARHAGFTILMLMLEGNRVCKLRNMGKGFLHGMTERMGRIPEADRDPKG
jgi:rhamnosyltransferase